jgi:hypothetical protein
MTAFIALIIAGMAFMHNKLAARIDPKRAQWIMIGAFFALPPVLVGFAFAAAFVADAIHGPYAR